MSQRRWVHGKYPVKTSCMSDDLSGDMLAPSWPNLVLNKLIKHHTVTTFKLETTGNQNFICDGGWVVTVHLADAFFLDSQTQLNVNFSLEDCL